jgi:serine/threonine protein kinase
LDPTDPAGASPDRFPPGPPERFGRYVVIKWLARGGMADLYLARQDGVGGFEKLVVVKRVLDELAGDAEITAMLGDEARLGAQLQHPNIVQVHELGEQDGRAFYVMEFLEGENLRALWRRVIPVMRRFPVPIAIAIVRAVAAALHYAHEARDLSGRRLDVIHRDVSPHNVIITYHGAIKLVDFGIAKAQNRRSQKTRTGALKGKLSYMSPEQARARPLDRRSDVFSLGIVLWELLCGVRLFERGGDFDTMRAIIEEPILPVSVHLPEVPPELEAIVQRALTRELDLRYPTARALDEALEQVVLDHGLQVSDLQISEFMDLHFAERIDSWREAHRQGGSAIARHFSTRDLPTLDSNEIPADRFDKTLPHTPTPTPRVPPSLDVSVPGPYEPVAHRHPRRQCRHLL